MMVLGVFFIAPGLSRFAVLGFKELETMLDHPLKAKIFTFNDAIINPKYSRNIQYLFWTR